MKSINKSKVDQFVKLAAKNLQGEWLIVGGAALTLLGDKGRVTIDIDIAGPDTATQADTIHLMNLAQTLKLPPEAINQAAAFFVRKIPDWESRRVLIAKGKQSKIFRPDATLFIQLKIARLSELDLNDCLKIIKLCDQEELDRKFLKKQIEKKMNSDVSHEQLERLRQIFEALKNPA